MAAAKPAGAGGTYTVQQGDTLSSIARKTGVGTTALKQANGMKDGLLKIGQTLKVPAGGTVQAAAAKPTTAKPAVDPVTTATTPPAAKTTETLASYTPPKKDAKVIQQAEDDDAVAPDATGIGKMRWPVRGRVISGFGSGKDGVDIAVPEGTPIKAAENGVVIYAGDGLKEFGNTVLVRHENGLVTVYGHASSIEVQRGQKVKRGQEIALSGMSGTTDSPKLHFEVRKNSAPVDPSGYLE
jgi:murein DD-endopeptidase MepM/ murein hydrolase activator NlpD